MDQQPATSYWLLGTAFLLGTVAVLLCVVNTALVVGGAWTLGWFEKVFAGVAIGQMVFGFGAVEFARRAYKKYERQRAFAVVLMFFGFVIGSGPALLYLVVVHLLQHARLFNG